MTDTQHVGSQAEAAAARPAGARSLDPNDFSYYGFGPLLKGEERKISRLSILHGEPAVSIVDNAIFVPSVDQRTAGQPRFSGGLLTADGQPVSAANLYRKGGRSLSGFTEPVLVAPDRAVDEEVVYLGLLHNHYGRFLLESLSRIWHMDAVDPSVKVVFNRSTAAQGSLSNWMRRLLAMFGVPPERILAPEAPTRMRRALVPEPLFEQHGSAHTEMIRPFHAVAARYAGDSRSSQQPVYLSRRLLKSHKRSIVGEAELESVLQENGFRIAYPETMTIEDQIRLVNEHTDIFSSLGSAAHTVLFALGKPNLHLLASREGMPANFFLCSALAQIPTTFINCLGLGGRSSPHTERKQRRAEYRDGGAERPADLEAGSQSTPQLVDLPVFVNYLTEQGFVKDPSRALLAAPNPALQDHYDEAWLYQRVRQAAAKSIPLPAEIESEGVRLAPRSWPVSLVLAEYFAQTKNASSAATMVHQFLELAAAEPDASRLDYFRSDVVRVAPRMTMMCAPGATSRLTAVLKTQFQIGSHERDGTRAGSTEDTAT